MTYQILTCPNCNGAGCPTCQNTGKVRVAEQEMQKLKQMLGQSSPSPETFTPPASPQPIKSTTNLAGIIAFSILSILAGGAVASWYFLKTFKPFFAGLITLLTLIGARFAWKNNFFELQEPDDFLKAIKRLT
ncbi:hypothetical protein KKE75_01520 [Patescibacteria group bacterium]|nr:hypothetical protein [Patescibacteria group bacterium]